MVSRRLLGSVTLAFTLLTLLAPQAAIAQGADPAGAQLTATIQAASGTVRAGGPAVSLPVEVINADHLGATTVVVQYDKARLKPVGWQASNAFDIVLCNINHDSDEDKVPDSVSCAAISMLGVSTGSTPVSLASISWQAVTRVEADTATQLRVSVEGFANERGIAMDAVAQNGELLIQKALPRMLLPFMRR